MKKKALEIPKIVYTDQFLRFIATYTKDFKNNNGYGKWLAEYKRMENLGMFEPEKLRELFIKILDGTSTLSYIYWDAVHFICTRALDAAKAFSLVSTTTTDAGLKGKIALINDEPIDPAPPITNKLFSLILDSSTRLDLLISSKNILFLLFVIYFFIKSSN